jgi:hypothetical protein
MACEVPSSTTVAHRNEDAHQTPSTNSLNLAAELVDACALVIAAPSAQR